MIVQLSCTKQIPAADERRIIIDLHNGFLALAQLPPVFLFASKNSPLIALLLGPGVDYTKLNYVHRAHTQRWAGRFLFLGALVHGSLWINNHLLFALPILTQQKEASGVAALATLCIIVLTSVAPDEHEVLVMWGDTVPAVSTFIGGGGRCSLSAGVALPGLDARSRGARALRHPIREFLGWARVLRVAESVAECVGWSADVDGGGTRSRCLVADSQGASVCRCRRWVSRLSLPDAGGVTCSRSALVVLLPREEDVTTAGFTPAGDAPPAPGAHVRTPKLPPLTRFFTTLCYHTHYAAPWIFPPLALYGFLR
ncbi:hypothetical protein B0H13DRAFT_2314332 [Mycena leptocephala]|nr:hypothetical protein B0H13DRAFT_2314332 [Mycena leptocephala]